MDWEDESLNEGMPGAAGLACVPKPFGSEGSPFKLVPIAGTDDAVGPLPIGKVPRGPFSFPLPKEDDAPGLGVAAGVLVEEFSVTTEESSVAAAESGRVTCGFHQEGIWKTVPFFSFNNLDKSRFCVVGEVGKK